MSEVEIKMVEDEDKSLELEWHPIDLNFLQMNKLHVI